MQERQRVVGLLACLAGKICDRAVGFGQRRGAQIEARRKALDRAAHDAGGILHVDLALDLHAEFVERAFRREGVGDVAERVLVLVEAAVFADIDAPAHHIVAVMIARGEAQRLDHAVGRRVVAVAGLMRNADAHGCILSSIRARKTGFGWSPASHSGWDFTITREGHYTGARSPHCGRTRPTWLLHRECEPVRRPLSSVAPEIH